MKTLAIVVTEDAYDKILIPLGFAYLMASEDTQVDMLFVNWAVRAMTAEGASNLHIDGRHAVDEDKVRAGIAKVGLPTDMYEVIKALKATGCVNMYACSMAAAIFGVDETNLIPESEGIVGAAWFLNEKADKADHCQYF
jgi:peroxiredoxin family protein